MTSTGESPPDGVTIPDPGEPIGPVPKPHLRRLGDLIGQMSEVRRPVAAGTDSPRPPASPAVALFAYRIVQDAVTPRSSATPWSTVFTRISHRCSQ